MTVSACILLLMVIPLLVGASYLGFAVFQVALIFIIMILFFSLCEIFYLRSRLKIKPLPAKAEIIRGEDAKFVVLIELKTCFLPAHLTISAYYGQNDTTVEPQNITTACHLKPRKEERVNLTLNARHVGLLEIDSYTVVLRSLFGLWQKKYRLKTEKFNLTQLVLPQIKPVAQELTQAVQRNKFRALEERRVPDRTVDVDTLREYNSGDDMRRIHWPVSARMSDFIVKEYIAPLKLRNCIIPEVKLTTLKQKTLLECEYAAQFSDLVCETALGICEQLLRDNCETRLELGDFKNTSHFQGRLNDLPSMRRALAHSTLRANLPLGHILAMEFTHPTADNYIVLCGQLDHAVCTALLELCSVSYGVTLLTTEAVVRDEALLKDLEQLRLAGVNLMSSLRRSEVKA